MDVVDPVDLPRVLLDGGHVEVRDTGSWPLRTTTHDSSESGLPSISWCGTYGGTYAAFVLDPDGNNIGAVCHGEPD